MESGRILCNFYRCSAESQISELYQCIQMWVTHWGMDNFPGVTLPKQSASPYPAAFNCQFLPSQRWAPRAFSMLELLTGSILCRFYEGSIAFGSLCVQQLCHIQRTASRSSALHPMSFKKIVNNAKLCHITARYRRHHTSFPNCLISFKDGCLSQRRKRRHQQSLS